MKITQVFQKMAFPLEICMYTSNKSMPSHIVIFLQEYYIQQKKILQLKLKMK